MRTSYDNQYESGNTSDRPGFGRGGRSHGHGHHFGPGTGHGPFTADSGREGERPRFRHGGFGRPGFGPGGPGFGPGGPSGRGEFGPGFGPRGFGGRGPRARKGDVRTAMLSLLDESSSNGYGLIKAIAAKTNDAWRPSPGSVYPTLAQLVDEGLIETTGGDGARSEFRLTDAGRTYVGEHADEIANAWASATAGQDERGELFEATGKLFGAVRQFATDASAEQRAQAAAKLDELRRELYRILGE